MEHGGVQMVSVEMGRWFGFVFFLPRKARKHTKRYFGAGEIIGDAFGLGTSVQKRWLAPCRSWVGLR
ncbi:hypothetical protein Enr17x_60770 [Gimesia fumaroli]|uniref:Uncharacterized protein n=1 Tax=Gimesia fumaroli TaxID=2527976 RepID=A0A518ILN0_9PLAN|nr:hypothetical protein Enr17x_60770 [Gimesia fumaroli]